MRPVPYHMAGKTKCRCCARAPVSGAQVGRQAEMAAVCNQQAACIPSAHAMQGHIAPRHNCCFSDCAKEPLCMHIILRNNVLPHPAMPAPTLDAVHEGAVGDGVRQGARVAVLQHQRHGAACGHERKCTALLVRKPVVASC